MSQDLTAVQIFGDGATDITRTVHLTPASAITVRPVRWAWHERIPAGALSLIGGREGIGKTACAATIAADLTRGLLPGAYYGTPRSVIVAAPEDSWEHTIVPRFMAAGANLDRVFRVDVWMSEGVETSVSLPRDLPGLERIIRNVDAVALVLDPILSRLDGALDSHKDADVRRALEPLVALADATGVATLGIIHVNKSTSTDPLTTLMASRAFAAVARAVLFVMQDPDDEHTRLLGQAKNNLGRADLPTLFFHIVGVKVADTDQGPVWTGKLEWLGETGRSIREAVEAAAAVSGDRTATSEAADWLRDYLTNEGGTADSAAVKREGAKTGHSSSALKRARQRLRIVSDARGFPRRTYWILPTQSDQSAQPGESELTGLTEPTGCQSDQWAQSDQLHEGSLPPVPLPAAGGANGESFRFDPDPIGRRNGDHS